MLFTYQTSMKLRRMAAAVDPLRFWSEVPRGPSPSSHRGFMLLVGGIKRRDPLTRLGPPGGMLCSGPRGDQML